MSLTTGTGPFAGAPGGQFNFSLDHAPKHRIFFADYLPRLRAMLDGAPLLDTTRAKLLYETGILPVPYIPLEDFDRTRLVRTDRSTHCPFKGDASYWSVDEHANIVWAYEDPKPESAWLKGYAAVYFNRMDVWLVEDEPVLGHLRDPYHRVDVHSSSRAVTVTANGEVIARSERPKLLFETGFPIRPYLPREDVLVELTAHEGKHTVCPYKGEASYWSIAGIEDAAWSYEDPRAEAAGIEGLVAFDPALVTVELSDSARPVPR
jgi:uncharacterized protein (DUF427 family)